MIQRMRLMVKRISVLSVRVTNINYNIVCLAKWSYKLEFKLPCFFVSYFPISILCVVQLKLFYFYNVYKQESLYSKVNNITTLTNLLILSLLL